ncbi:SufBD protein [Hydrogenophaga crassostreae]|uniref:SufBD protein n=1 Tax=Hydrogenophaga crassostreae TaxID=1763535 RepID=A0A167IT69_9BURK|nr:SufD family Fe-S cluster assembly protein [Hydrogenophaga crassostreae]AOW14419.1 SufBD protein [Hydrogenophaga crassostreae]OAD43556.1 SufBD protein [Hydrogenophaga crassostreae]
MDHARADMLAARDRLAHFGWIPRHAEAFRHQPPPPAAAWLGEETENAKAGCDAHPLTGAGWTLHPLGETPQGRIDAHWLDASDPTQRKELFADLPLPMYPGGAVALSDIDARDAAPFAWAHRALCRRGLRLNIGGAEPAGRATPETVWVQLRHQPRSAVEAPMLVIEVQAGVHCVLVETHDREAVACGQAVVQNLRAHIRLGAGATLQHLRCVMPGSDDRIAHHLHVQLADGARYEQGLIANGGQYHLQRQVVELKGERAVASTAGLLLAAGSSLEQQVRLQHTGERTRSSVEALALASGAARAVVNAHTRIAPGAADADVRQRLSGVPTGGQPRLILRPHLEIHHDQVQAAHGATWGALPEDALFYARQRGLDERSARGLIIEGMAHALFMRAFDDVRLIETLDLAGLLRQAVARHLADGSTMPSTTRETQHG